MGEATRTPSAAAIRAAEALYSQIDEQAQVLLFGGTRASVIDGVARIIDDETGLPGLLAAAVLALGRFAELDGTVAPDVWQGNYPAVKALADALNNVTGAA